MSEPFILGVNYWPRRKAMYWWSNFEADEVREEFAVIAAAGMTMVRIFLLWDDWQPTPDSVAPDCLKNLGVVLDAAVEHNLKLDVTFFTGHMSGPNWSPKWLHDPKMKPAVNRSLVVGGQEVEGWYRNFFEDDVALNAQRLLIDTVVGEYVGHAGLGMWNLGNEPDLFAIPPTQVIGQQWTRDLVERIKAIDPQTPVTNGLHVASLGSNTAQRVDLTYAETDVAVMHGYPMYMPWVDDPLDPDFVPYMCALTTALCGKPTLMEEFGGCTAPPGEPSQQWGWKSYGGQHRTQFMAGEADFADYIEQVLPKLVEVGASGAMLWCFADYAPELWDKPPCLLSKHERHFGLVRPDGSLKPHVQVIKDFAATNPVLTPPENPFKMDITVDEFYAEPMRHFARLFFQKYRKQV